MKTKFDIEKWSRKEHYLFFKNFDEPFWGLTVNVDCTAIYKYAKENRISFFTLSLHKLLETLNNILEFRLRIESNELFEYSKIHASATIGRDDGTFGFSFIQYDSDFKLFEQTVQFEIKRVAETPGLAMTDQTERFDTIHFSALPWLAFSSFSHARHFAFDDSVPKISTGKLMKEDDKIIMPISLHTHHAILDGFHVGQFFNQLEKMFRDCDGIN